jgi:hypothetical protein
VSQLWQQATRLDELRVRVRLVTFDNDRMAENYVRSSGIKWPLLLDSDQALYKAYALPKASWWSLYHPKSIASYLRLMASGRMPGKPGSDLRQLGGDVLIDPAGIVRFHHVSKSPHDRPDIDYVLSHVESGNSGAGPATNSVGL